MVIRRLVFIGDRTKKSRGCRLDRKHKRCTLTPLNVVRADSSFKDITANSGVFVGRVRIGSERVQDGRDRCGSAGAMDCDA